jgi:hypothetical protein
MDHAASRELERTKVTSKNPARILILPGTRFFATE